MGEGGNVRLEGVPRGLLEVEVEVEVAALVAGLFETSTSSGVEKRSADLPEFPDDGVEVDGGLNEKDDPGDIKGAKTRPCRRFKGE